MYGIPGAMRYFISLASALLLLSGCSTVENVFDSSVRALSNIPKPSLKVQDSNALDDRITSYNGMSESMANITQITVAPRRDKFAPDIVIDGHFRNGCEKMGRELQKHKGNVFTITQRVWTGGPGVSCTQAIKPFRKVIPLSVVSRLPAGTYTVVVNGIQRNFSVQ